MSGPGLQINRNRGEDRFYSPVKAERNHNHNHTQNQNHKNLRRTVSDVVHEGGHCKVESSPLSNVERFLEAITPSIQAQYISKTTMRGGWRTCDVEFQPFFRLGDLWESFKEWSAYGVGVPLVLNGKDSVIQYYVPYLSGIQIYVDPSKSPIKSRRTSEDSDGDYFSRDSSSEGSSDSERSHFIEPHDISQKMDRLLLRDHHAVLQEGFSSDESEQGSRQGYLLFEYLEREQPYCRETLADKVSYLALRFPELKSLRSCDIQSSSWFSVAWYPIYRIPTGSTLRDLDACFLTYHSLHTPEDVGDSQAPVVIYPDEIDGIPKISLPVFGLASYKFRGSVWTSNGGTGHQLVESLSQAADNWLRLLKVNHPDFLFFCRNR